MVAIAEAFVGLDHGTMEIISDHLDEPDELAWIEHVARISGRPLTFLVGSNTGAGIWSLAERLNPEGLAIRPQVGARPASVLMMLEGTLNPMRQFPAYDEIKGQSFDEQRRALLDPAFRAKVLADEAKVARYADTSMMISTWDRMYVLPSDLSYEPSYADSIAGIAEARRLHVREVLMDVMAAGRPILYLLGKYRGDLSDQVTAMQREHSVFGLSDGGAHCGVLCDASAPTYMLAYMTRDRVKGPKLPIEFAVHKMTQDTALLYGMSDRGVIAPGYRADVNVIDYDALRLVDPQMVYDLPAGGKRLIQRAHGYRSTICNGEVTYENGEHTGVYPGRLVRGGVSAS
jgi:N-acyl-D-aspartate/D-glutamate deacylase